VDTFFNGGADFTYWRVRCDYLTDEKMVKNRERKIVTKDCTYHAHLFELKPQINSLTLSSRAITVSCKGQKNQKNFRQGVVTH